MKLALLAALLVSGNVLATDLDTPTGTVSVDEFKTGRPAPTIIIAHGCTGLNVSSYREWANQFRSWGYNAVLLDSFKPRGYSTGVCKTNNVPPTVRSQDIETTAEWLKKQPWHTGNIAVVGFSHGGATVLNVSSNPNSNVKAAIAFYPNCKAGFVGRNYSKAVMPTQIHLAQDDDWTPIAECQNTFTNQTAYVYPNTGHAFDLDLPDRLIHGHSLKYNKESHSLSQARVKAFFETNLGKGN